MKSLYIDCPNGMSGDMILAAFLDLGVPKEIIEAPLFKIGMKDSFSLTIEETKNYNFRGTKVSVHESEGNPKPRKWLDIQKLINNSLWEEDLRKKVFLVFESLARAEASVHGTDINLVHFHEIGAIDSLVDIIGVCACINYIKPSKIFCGVPPAGSGVVNTEHGLLSVPVPAVIELAKNHNIKLSFDEGNAKGELTTPTGLALMAILADNFTQPESMEIESIGVGLGHRDLDRPNFLRIWKMNYSSNNQLANENSQISLERIITQEAWIDDATPEDVSNLINRLRREGAIEVITQPIQMKKGRTGICIKAIVPPTYANSLMKLWLTHSTSLGIREREEYRWTIQRKDGYCNSIFGKIRVKQALRPNNKETIKPEHDELVRISLESGKSIDEIRQEILSSIGKFIPKEQWRDKD